MKWTSTQHTSWAEACRKFGSLREPFRLDHVFGPVEAAFCNNFCAEFHYRQRRQGSSVTFAPEAD